MIHIDLRYVTCTCNSQSSRFYQRLTIGFPGLKFYIEEPIWVGGWVLSCIAFRLTFFLVMMSSIGKIWARYGAMINKSLWFCLSSQQIIKLFMINRNYLPILAYSILFLLSNHTTSFNYAVQVSSRGVLIEQANSGQFKCGQVPVYHKIHRVSIEPDLRLKALSNNRAAVTIADNSSTKTTNTTELTTSDDGNFRILYGLDAKFGEWPWIVKLDVCKPNADCEGCTGSLLNDRWLITAGHCVSEEWVWAVINRRLVIDSTD